jgi:hypothetical protein
MPLDIYIENEGVEWENPEEWIPTKRTSRRREH